MTAQGCRGQELPRGISQSGECGERASTVRWFGSWWSGSVRGRTSTVALSVEVARRCARQRLMLGGRFFIPGERKNGFGAAFQTIFYNKLIGFVYWRGNELLYISFYIPRDPERFLFLYPDFSKRLCSFFFHFFLSQ